ncbi:MAG: hypothetical protein K9K37_05130 [Desulfocapsa sp.]|nr:hypothetical protein [Desulfocapsa sp.]
MSCATPLSTYLPELDPIGFGEENQSRLIRQNCEQSFVQGDWQLVHSIVFEMADGHGATVIGVTVIDGERLKTGLMGVEGFVLFEAEQDKGKSLQVNRALPPFDNPEFARGLMRDVQIIFLQPSGESPVTGRFAEGEEICRYTGKEGRITDVIPGTDGSRRVNVYDADGKRFRAVRMTGSTSTENAMVAETIRLVASGVPGYTLTMTLIGADKI